jgi:hypothetical protein
MSHHTRDDKVSIRLKQMREEYERIKEEVHQSLTHTNGIFPDSYKVNDSKLLLNLSLPSGGFEPNRLSAGALMSPDAATI